NFAWSHHGWDWAEKELSELKGIVKAVNMSPPHPRLDVETPENEVWRIELGNPSQTKQAGFTADSAKPGDQVHALGNRSRDPNEKRLKAVRITVGDKTYDIYPNRIPR